MERAHARACASHVRTQLPERVLQVPMACAGPLPMQVRCGADPPTANSAGHVPVTVVPALAAANVMPSAKVVRGHVTAAVVHTAAVANVSRPR
jgi:hypothetical protein